MHTIRNWIVENKQGRSLFYFRLYTINEISAGLYFDSNILFRITDARLALLIEQLVSYKIPIEKKDRIAEQLFILIKEIGYYEQFYFDDTVLDKTGKLNFFMYEFKQRFYLERLDKCYEVPISATHNPEIYAIVRKYFHLHKEVLFETTKPITQAAFECQLCTDELKQAYVEEYDEENAFYIYTDNTDKVSYFIINNNELKLVFDLKK